MVISNNTVLAMDTATIKLYVVTIKGYDPVAYFTENRTTQGKSSNSYNWNEASWHFTTPEHHDLFAADSEKYAPKYGASERSV